MDAYRPIFSALSEEPVTTPVDAAPVPHPAYEGARLAYANACEQMGIAHAVGTRAEWQAAERRECETRHALDAAVASLRARAEEAERERDAIAHAIGVCYDHDHGCGGAGPVDQVVSAVRDLQSKAVRVIDAESSLERMRERVAGLAALVAPLGEKSGPVRWDIACRLRSLANESAEPGEGT